MADHPVPQGLPVHAGSLRSLFAAHTRKRIGDRKQPSRHAGIGFGLGQFAQDRRRAILSDCQRRHDALRIITVGNHDPAPLRNRSSATGVALFARWYYTTALRRFNELKRLIGGVTQRMLTLTLRQLERNGLVSRTVFPTIPPRVDYELTPLGHSLCMPI